MYRCYRVVVKDVDDEDAAPSKPELLVGSGEVSTETARELKEVSERFRIYSSGLGVCEKFYPRESVDQDLRGRPLFLSANWGIGVVYQSGPDREGELPRLTRRAMLFAQVGQVFSNAEAGVLGKIIPEMAPFEVIRSTFVTWSAFGHIKTKYVSRSSVRPFGVFPEVPHVLLCRVYRPRKGAETYAQHLQSDTVEFQREAEHSIVIAVPYSLETRMLGKQGRLLPAEVQPVIYREHRRVGGVEARVLRWVEGGFGGEAVTFGVEGPANDSLIGEPLTVWIEQKGYEDSWHLEVNLGDPNYPPFGVVPLVAGKSPPKEGNCWY